MGSSVGVLEENKQGASNAATGGRFRASGRASGSGGGGKRGGAGGKKAAGAAAAAEQQPQTPLAKLAKEEAAKGLTVAGQVHNVPISQIHVGLNPRETFDPEGIAELAKSIKDNGLVQPPTVRPHEGGYQLVAGERRYRAMQALGMREVPVIIKTMSDEEARKMALTENVARKDMLPGETGRAYKAFKDSGMKPEDIAAMVGKTTPAAIQNVKDHIALAETLEPHLQALVDKQASGKGKGLAFSLVGPLSNLTPANREKAAEAIMSKGLGVGKAKALIADLHAREQQMTMFGNPEHGHQTAAAHEKYSTAMERFTNVLGGLDDKTVEQMTGALKNPEQEQQRLMLMINQLKRIHTTIGRSIAHNMAAGM